MTIEVKWKLAEAPGFNAFEHLRYYHDHDDVSDAMDHFVANDLVGVVTERREFDGWGLMKVELLHGTLNEYAFVDPDDELEEEGDGDEAVPA